MAAKTGRKRKKTFLDPTTGKEIDGLYWYKSRQQFCCYPIGEDGQPHRKLLGDNLWEAIQKMRALMPEKEVKRVSVTPAAVKQTTEEEIELDELPTPSDMPPSQPIKTMTWQQLGEQIKTEDEEKGEEHIEEIRQEIDGTDIVTTIRTRAQITEAEIIAIVRAWIERDFKDFQQKLALPLYMDWDKTHIEIPTTQIKDVYVKYKKSIGAGRQIFNDVKNHWGLFVKYVGNTISTQLDLTKIDDYRAAVLKTKNKPATKRNYFRTVREIVNCYSDNIPDTSHTETIKHLQFALRRLKSPRQDKKQVIYFTPQQYQSILKEFDSIKYKTIFMLAANCAIRQGDIVNITPDNINFENNTYCKAREKTGYLQGTMLMPETVQQLKEWIQYKDDHNIESKWFFTPDENNNAKKDPNKKLYADQIRKKFLKAREAAGVSSKIKFSHLRKSARTIPGLYNYKNDEAMAILTGHQFTSSIVEYYRARLPQMTFEAVKCLRDYYYNNSEQMPKNEFKLDDFTI